MRYMALALLLFTLGLNTSFAAPSKSTSKLVSEDSLIHKINAKAKEDRTGQIRLSGMAGIGYSSFQGTIFRAMVQPEKYLSNSFALGARLHFNNANGYDQYDIGPSAYYEFWNHKAWRSYLGQNISYVKYTGTRDKRDTVDYKSETQFGIGWGFFDLYFEQRNMLDKSNIKARQVNGVGFRLVFNLD